MKRPNYIRVLLVDEDNILSRGLAAHLANRGFETNLVTNSKDARAQILAWKPRFVLANLILPDGSALHLIDFIKGEKSLRHHFIHVLVMSGHNLESNVRQCMNHGAKDYIVKPITYEDMTKRLVFHSRSYRHLNEVVAKEPAALNESSVMLHLTDLVLRQALGGGALAEVLFNLTRMVSMKVDGVRCNIVHCVDQRVGYVVTSNDDRGAAGIQLDLYKYPEILHVMNTKTLIAIENLDESAELRNVRESVKDISFNSMIVCPIARKGHAFGTLSLRMPPEKQTVTDNEIRFVEIVSQVVSLVLGSEMHKEALEFWLKEAQTQPAAILLRQVKNS